MEALKSRHPGASHEHWSRDQKCEWFENNMHVILYCPHTCTNPRNIHWARLLWLYYVCCGVNVDILAAVHLHSMLHVRYIRTRKLGQYTHKEIATEMRRHALLPISTHAPFPFCKWCIYHSGASAWKETVTVMWYGTDGNIQHAHVHTSSSLPFSL